LAQDLTLSYVPGREQREWRTMTRTRVEMSAQQVRLRNQMEGLLEQAQIKLSSVLSDLLGVSGRRILREMVKGETNPACLASLATSG
jgi:predicted site-specific integrase-resolvase